jgi:hypothetical protein
MTSRGFSPPMVNIFGTTGAANLKVMVSLTSELLWWEMDFITIGFSDSVKAAEGENTSIETKATARKINHFIGYILFTYYNECLYQNFCTGRLITSSSLEKSIKFK